MFVFIFNFHVFKKGIIGMVFIVNLGVQLGAGCFGHEVKAEAVGLKDSKKKKVEYYFKLVLINYIVLALFIPLF